MSNVSAVENLATVSPIDLTHVSKEEITKSDIELPQVVASTPLLPLTCRTSVVTMPSEVKNLSMQFKTDSKCSLTGSASATLSENSDVEYGDFETEDRPRFPPYVNCDGTNQNEIEIDRIQRNLKAENKSDSKRSSTRNSETSSCSSVLTEITIPRSKSKIVTVVVDVHRSNSKHPTDSESITPASCSLVTATQSKDFCSKTNAGWCLILTQLKIYSY